MKNLKLKALEISAQQVLTREQLKKMVGGDNPNCAGTGSNNWYCNKDGKCTSIGYMSCDAASAKCSGGTITTSSSCTPLVVVPDPKPL